MGVFDKVKKTIEVERYSEFSNLLTEARKSRGFTQATLAKKLGKSRACIANYEIGKNLPPLPDFIDICVALNVKPNELLGYEPSSVLSK